LPNGRPARGSIFIGTGVRPTQDTIMHRGEQFRAHAPVMKSTLHELQHATRQGSEGFPEGASASQVGQDNYWKNTGETEARLTPYRQHLDDKQRREYYPGADPTDRPGGFQPQFQHDFPYSHQVMGQSLAPGLWGAKYGWDKSPENPANAPVQVKAPVTQQPAPQQAQPPQGFAEAPEGPYRPDPKLDRQTENKTAHPGWISQRLPVGKGKGAENPLKQSLMIGTKEFLMEPKRADKAVGLLKQVPGFEARGKRESTPDYANRFVRHAADNLLHLHDRMDPGLLSRAQRWYPGGRQLIDKWSKDYKVPDIGVAGNIAALSPQKDWFENVSLGNRVLDAYAQRKDVKVNSAVLEFAHERLKPEQAAILASLKGKSLDALIKNGQMHEASMLVRSWDEVYGDRRHRLITPEGKFGDFERTKSGGYAGTGWQSFNAIRNALTSIAHPTLETVNLAMGEAHKVRNFYNNLLDPWSPHKDVTVDTHAGAAGLLSPLSGNDEMTTYILGQGGPGSNVTGVRGLYGLLADAHRVAAQERGLIPRAAQSITWEGTRGLFRPEWKGNKANRAAVAAIWKEAKDGKISKQLARQRIEALAGGMAPPAWK
jgi:hypothetical protein